jgi:TrmH family RNA methyltransferase
MKNMGLGTLRLVQAPPGFDGREARALAHGAGDVLDAAIPAVTLAEALRSSTFVVGTSGRSQPGYWSPRHLAVEGPACAAPGRLALVFGPEATGLRNDELAMCHATVHIPTDLAQPSLNLAQAVLVLAYELRVAFVERPSAPVERLPSAPVERATVSEQEEALASLRRGLLGIGYLNAQNPGPILSEVRQLLARAGPTRREVRLLRGIARQIQWAAGQIAQAPVVDP